MAMVKTRILIMQKYLVPEEADGIIYFVNVLCNIIRLPEMNFGLMD